MELKHNDVFRIPAGEEKGLYRVVLVDCPLKTVAAARLDPDEHAPGHKPGRRPLPKLKKKRRSTKAKRLLCTLSWFSFDELDGMTAAVNLQRGSVKLPSRLYRPVPPGHLETYNRRKATMKKFLDPRALHESVLMHHGWGGLVNEVAKDNDTSKVHVYMLISFLCLFGFMARALRPQFQNCGAPGITRPADPGVRQKSGRKTTGQRIALLTGQPSDEIIQPGMTTKWRERILAADSCIPTPKPAMAQRVDLIRASHFVSSSEEVGGKLLPVLGPRGTYPSKEQIRRVLTTAYQQLDRLLQSTTQGHYDRNHRGLKGKSWNGVAGPGHTWAIDSTIGNLYLRSSINRAWILGRPIVYIIVDTWSTAIVGFYVCLSGPSWRMARIAVFNACAPVELMSDLWGPGFQQCTLSPAPTLCAILLCDRGEYLSQAASVDGLEAKLALSYTPPYRPDYKGIVEVLHRIQKDIQYFLIPGAIDARRKEYELRRYAPWRSALTIREFVQYLNVIFNAYNLTANRMNRLDAHMIAASVQPNPSGLWNWGHSVGIGFRRETSLDELVSTWLDPQSALVTREGLKFAGRTYSLNGSPTNDWTARARNFGRWEVDVLTYLGSVSRIWTADHAGDGLLQLDICDHANASAELTVEEVADAFEIQRLRAPEIAHKNATIGVQTVYQTKAMVKEAIRLTAEAEACDGGPSPSMSEARAMEEAALPTRTEDFGKRQAATTSDAEDAYLQAMAEILQASNKA